MIRIILISSGRYDCNHILLFKSVLILHRISKQKVSSMKNLSLIIFHQLFCWVPAVAEAQVLVTRIKKPRQLLPVMVPILP